MTTRLKTDFQQRVVICGVDERDRLQSRQITHLLTIGNPGGPISKPPWFHGPQLHLVFGDVVSEGDARQCRTKAATLEDIQQAIQFCRSAWSRVESIVLISCNYGASRSPALAYVAIADQLGPGREAEALQLVMQIRSAAVPNRLVVQLGDKFLQRHGALLEPLREFYRFLNEQLAPRRTS